MTTKVTIDPAGHTVEVALSEGAPRTTTTETLAPGTPPREFWLHGNRVLTIRETGTA